MCQRFPIGSVARLYLDLVIGGAGQTGQAPVIAVQRRADGSWFNATTTLFQPASVTNSMSELDAANLPGRYFFDFDHNKDLTVATEFVVKKSNPTPPATLVYEDIAFGALPAVVSPLLCSVQGAVVGRSGSPLGGALVQATLIPVRTDALGRGYEADAPVRVYSAADGAFDLPLARGATYRLQIGAIGYDRRALVPDQPSVLFTDL